MRHAAAALVSFALLTAALPAVAQPRSEAARIEVRFGALPSGTSLPVVSVTAIRDGIPGPELVTGTIVDGIATFDGLDPGTWVVFVAERSRTISAAPREHIIIDGTTLEVVDRQSSGEGQHLTSRWFTDPASARDIWQLVETIAPFVIADRMDNGGLATGRTALLGSRGSSWTTTRLTVGGATMPAPNERGLMPFALDLSAFSAVSVISGLAPVEFGTPGVVLSLTPRAPANRRRGAADVSVTTPGMVGDNRLPSAPSIQRTERWGEGSLLYELPVGTATGLLVSAGRSEIRFQERDLPARWDASATSLLAHLTGRPDDDRQWRMLGAFQRVVYPFDDRRQFRNRQVVERGSFAQLVSTWDRSLASGAHLEWMASVQHGRFTPDPPSTQGGTLDRVTDGFVPAPAARTRTTQWELGATWHAAPLAWRGSRHDVRAGVQTRRVTLSATALGPVDVAEMVAGLPARVWRPDTPPGPAGRAVFESALFAASRMALTSNLTLDAGVRAEFTRGTMRGGEQPITWATISPRTMAQWRLGPVALFAGAAWYSEPLAPSQFRHGDRGEVTWRVHRWHDLDGNALFSPGEDGVLVARAGRGPDVASIDPDLRAPRTVEHTGGIELRLGQHVTLRSSAIWRRMRGLLGSVNTGVPSSAYAQRLIADPSEDWLSPADDRPLLVYDRLPSSFGLDRFLLTNPDDHTAHYEGVETEWILRTRPAELLFGAMMYRSRSWSGHLGFGPLENDHGVIGEVFERPNARPVLQGSYFFDRSYVGKLSGSVHLPFAMRFGFAARYQDGQPFSRVVVVPDLSTGPEMVHAYRTGRTRYTYTLTLDLRLQKTFTLAGRAAALRLDVFNATNHKNEVEEDALTTPLFRLSTAVQPPPTARLGLRISW